MQKSGSPHADVPSPSCLLGIRLHLLVGGKALLGCLKAVDQNNTSNLSSNYPSGNQWDAASRGGGTSDETYRRPILNGTAVYVYTLNVPDFVRSTFQALPKDFKITLVSGSHDDGQPLHSFGIAGHADVRKFLADPRLHRWFVQNYDLIGCRRANEMTMTMTCSDITHGIDGWTQEMIDKVKPLPIGLDIHTHASKIGLGPQLLPRVCSQRIALQKVRSGIPSFATRVSGSQSVCLFSSND